MKPKKKRSQRGRPPLPATERQDASLLLRMRPAELRALRRAAREDKKTVGIFAREHLLALLRQRGYLQPP